MHDIKVAIWMVTYNHEDYIAEAIESVMSQKTDFKYKLFIGEDCSTDKTGEICKEFKSKYPDRIELFLNENNIGAAKNAFFIYDQCFKSGAKYIAMCEGDDYWTDSLKLQKQIGFLDENKDYVLSFHEINILTDNKIVDNFITKVPENHESIEDLANYGNYIHTPTVVFRNVIDKIPLEFKYSPIGDYLLFTILARYGKMKYINEVMAIYRHGIGIITQFKAINGNKNNVILFSSILSYLKDDAVKEIFIKKQLESINHFENAMHNQYNNSFVSDSLFFKTIKSLGEDYRNPKKILRRIRNKILKRKNEK